MNNFVEYDYLCHYGMLGMKWGIRRYQPYPKGSSNKGRFIDERAKRKEAKEKHITENMGGKEGRTKAEKQFGDGGVRFASARMDMGLTREQALKEQVNLDIETSLLFSILATKYYSLFAIKYGYKVLNSGKQYLKENAPDSRSASIANGLTKLLHT